MQKMECAYQKLQCGGCANIEMPYDRLLAEKQSKVQKILGEYGTIKPIIGAEEPFHYRCKLISSFGTDKNGKLICGLYAQGSHRILPTAECLLENQQAAKVIQAVYKCAVKQHYTAYDEDRRSGLLRHVLIRYGAASGQIMVVLVTSADILPGSKNFVTALKRECPEITTVVQNTNKKFTSAVLGETCKTLYGPGFIEDELCGCRFIISPTAFYQVNPAQTEKLYWGAIQAANLKADSVVLDAYCGTGTIGLIAAKKSGCKVLGIESNASAIRDAIRNAKRNRISDVRFIAADAGTFMKQLATEKQIGPDVVFMDPPRSGSDAAFLNAVLSLAPKRVVYVSCNPETQARDLQLLTKLYRVEWIQPVDLFPYTEHVETVCLLSRVK